VFSRQLLVSQHVVSHMYQLILVSAVESMVVWYLFVFGHVFELVFSYMQQKRKIISNCSA
jgi:hypothetical protein